MLVEPQRGEGNDLQAEPVRDGQHDRDRPGDAGQDAHDGDGTTTSAMLDERQLGELDAAVAGRVEIEHGRVVRYVVVEYPGVGGEQVLAAHDAARDHVLLGVQGRVGARAM